MSVHNQEDVLIRRYGHTPIGEYVGNRQPSYQHNILPINKTSYQQNILSTHSTNMNFLTYSINKTSYQHTLST